MPCPCPYSVLAEQNLPRTCSALFTVNLTKTLPKSVMGFFFPIDKVRIKIIMFHAKYLLLGFNWPGSTRFHPLDLIPSMYIEGLPQCPYTMYDQLGTVFGTLFILLLGHLSSQFRLLSSNCP